ncbi:MAG TPA: glycosyltransferase [Polyangiaceae bacterium]|nr:glycosyltransferase [Polyangiaceae bacterium]
MRILHVTDRSSARGGADWHLLGVIEALAERGFEQHLAVERDDGSARSACAVSVGGLDRLDSLVARFRPNLVHVHNAIDPAVLAWVAARDGIATVQDHRSFCPGQGKLTLSGQICNAPMASSTCAGCFADAGYHARIQAVTEARLCALQRMRAITVLSHYMKRELALVGVSPERVHVIPPFVHGLDREARADGKACVLFAGRVVTAKGVHDAVEAWRRAGVALPLLVAGTGSARLTLDVEVTGWLPHARMSAVYRRARALVMPSRWQEPFGIVGLEALTMGVPVAAWRSGGIPEWHPGGDLLVDWGDLDALAGALRAAIETRVEAPAGFERDAIVDRMLAFYQGC